MPGETNITERLARYVAELTYDSLPAAVRHAARRALIDTVACAIAGSAEPAGRIARRLAEEDAGEGRATLLGTHDTGGRAAPRRVPAPSAALANAVAGHALDYDDVNAMGHPSVPVVFSALAAAEAVGAGGRELITAYVAGVELETKVNRAFSTSHYLAGWHSTSTVGVLGAAAAAAKLFHLDTEQTRLALGIAASQACGLRRNFGTMTKPFHAGHASWAGLTAARLAQAGFSADRSILESEQGYYSVLSMGPYEPTRAIAELDRWALVKPGLSVKKYPCCYCTHAAIDGALQMRQRHQIDASQVSAIIAELTPFYLSPLIHHRPQTGLQGKFSIEYTVAAAILDGRVTLNSFTDEMVQRPAAQELVSRISAASAEPPKGAPPTWARLTVRLRDGAELMEEITVPRGSSDNPMSDDEISDKFADCWRFGFAAADNTRMTKALELLWNLDRLERVTELTEQLA